jgi:hypothetical protein
MLVLRYKAIEPPYTSEDMTSHGLDYRVILCVNLLCPMFYVSKNSWENKQIEEVYLNHIEDT